MLTMWPWAVSRGCHAVESLQTASKFDPEGRWAPVNEHLGIGMPDGEGAGGSVGPLAVLVLRPLAVLLPASHCSSYVQDILWSERK